MAQCDSNGAEEVRLALAVDAADERQQRLALTVPTESQACGPSATRDCLNCRLGEGVGEAAPFLCARLALRIIQVGGDHGERRLKGGVARR